MSVCLHVNTPNFAIHLMDITKNLTPKTCWPWLTFAGPCKPHRQMMPSKYDPDRKKEWLANTKARNSNLMTEARCVSKYLQSSLIVKFGSHYQTTTSSYHSNLGLKHHNKAALAIFEMILQLKSTHSFINYCNYCMRGTKTFHRHGSLF